MMQGSAQRYIYYKAINTSSNTVPLKDVDDGEKVVIAKRLIVPDSIMNETRYDIVSGDNVNKMITDLQKNHEELMKVIDEMKKENQEIKKENQEIKKENQEIKKENREIKKNNQELNLRMDKMEAQIDYFRKEMTSTSKLMEMTGETLVELSKRPRYWE